jgi:hypothetical protein
MQISDVGHCCCAASCDTVVVLHLVKQRVLFGCGFRGSSHPVERGVLVCMHAFMSRKHACTTSCHKAMLVVLFIQHMGAGLQLQAGAYSSVAGSQMSSLRRT